MPVKITDHALVRYLERVKGFDLEPHRVEIVRICAAIEHVTGACTISSNGFKYECNGGAVVTVRPRGSGMPVLTRQNKARNRRFEQGGS